MATFTARELIEDSMKLIGVLSHGETAEAEEANDALRYLNQLIDYWNAQKLAIYVVNRTEHDLTSGKQVYTLGTGGDFDQQRPTWIDHMGIIQQQNTNQPIELPLKLLTTERWQREVPVKNITSALPTKVYVDGDFPLRNCSFWPYPNVGDLKVSIYWAEDLATFTTLSTSLGFPDGYQYAFKYNLAVRLHPEFVGTSQLSPVIAQEAADSLGMIKQINSNTHAQELLVDAALSPSDRFDWRTGDPQ